MNVPLQLLYLFILALPVASVAWTITHEEIAREFRDYCISESKVCRRIYQRKFFYLFTCVLLQSLRLGSVSHDHALQAVVS